MKTPLPESRTRPEKRGKTCRGSDAAPSNSTPRMAQVGSLEIIPSNLALQYKIQDYVQSAPAKSLHTNSKIHPWPIPGEISLRCSNCTPLVLVVKSQFTLCSGGTKSPSLFWCDVEPLCTHSSCGIVGTPTLFVGLCKTLGLLPAERHPLLLSFPGNGGV